MNRAAATFLASVFVVCTAPGAVGASRSFQSQSAAGPQKLTCEYRIDPLGIDVPDPRLGWMMEAPGRGEIQTAYEIQVAQSAAALARNQADLWDSGKVLSWHSSQVPYAGRPLVSRERCWWRVRIWDRDGRASAWSQPAWWEMGLLRPSDWQAEWIGYRAAPCPYLRRSFNLARPARRIVRARLYATALGLYELRLNGRRVGRDVFSPGWTDYHRRVQYQTYDVTRLVQPGSNALGMILGNGWYAGYLASFGPHHYGDHPIGLCELRVEYRDGAVQTITSDANWRASAGPILQSDLLMGESYDARRETPGWDRPGFDDGNWRPVEAQSRTDYPIHLDAERDPPVRETGELLPRAKWQSSPGVTVLDLGQNFAGRVRLKVHGPAGTVVTLRFAEMLNPDHSIYTANLRSARCTDTYTLRGTGEEVYEPRFTYHGFRYVEVTGYPGRVPAGAITGIVIGSDLPAAGDFACSNAMVNQLQHNIVWGERSNFLSVPTDCPQRDERLGWTGDAGIFAPTAAFNRDVASFYTKWTMDLEDSQTPDGAFPDVAPRIGPLGAGTPAWADAGILVPWTVYVSYGDTRLLREHYPAMVKWIEYCRRHSTDLVRPAEGYGDWLSIAADTPKDVLSTAYFAHSTRLLGRMARAIGKRADAERYETLFQQIRDAFNRAFVMPDGRIKGDTQTCYVLALSYDLLPPEKRLAAARYLVERIRQRDWHLSTGFLGVGHLLPALTGAGETRAAYRLLDTDTFPSWGYSIRQGATTIWERWDGWTRDRGFQTPAMNSFNHYSMGSVGEWMYTTAAGISLDPDQPGYHHILIHPRPGGGLTWARAMYRSPYGVIASAWKTGGKLFTLKLTIPWNTTATVTLPGAYGKRLTESGRPAAFAPDVRLVGRAGDDEVFEVGSGEYRFQSSLGQ